MTKGVITVESVAGRLAVAEVRRNPGKTSGQHAKSCGWSESHMSKSLTAMKKAGLVGFVRENRIPVWYVAEMIPAAQAAARAASKAAEAEQNKAALRRWRIKKGQGDAWEKRELSDYPTHHINATGPLPFVVKAPRSVFELGAA